MTILLPPEEMGDVRLSVLPDLKEWFEHNREWGELGWNNKRTELEGKAIALAQAKAIYDWGNEPCDNIIHDGFTYHKSGCKDCWQSLLDEIEAAENTTDWTGTKNVPTLSLESACKECEGSGTKYPENGTIRDEIRCESCNGTGKPEAKPMSK